MLTAAFVFLKTAVLGKLLVIESINMKENRLKVSHDKHLYQE